MKYLNRAKKWNLVLVALAPVVLLSVQPAFSAVEDESLESKLNNLSLPSNVAPAAITQEKLYSVQNRYTDLKRKSEFSLGAAKNFNSNSFVNMREIDLAYRFHINNRWNLGISGAYGFNELTTGAQVLLAKGNQLPDAAYVKRRADLLVGYNLFYGKFRLSMEQVLYFDQYLAIGPGLVTTQYGSSPAAVADVGFAFWLGRNASLRFGIKSEVFNEKRFADSSNVTHVLGHLDIGYAFGGKKL